MPWLVRPVTARVPVVVPLSPDVAGRTSTQVSTIVVPGSMRNGSHESAMASGPCLATGSELVASGGQQRYKGGSIMVPQRIGERLIRGLERRRLLSGDRERGTREEQRDDTSANTHSPPSSSTRGETGVDRRRSSQRPIHSMRITRMKFQAKSDGS